MQSEVCTFKVENIGTTSIDYSVYLDDIDERMNDKYVKFGLIKNDGDSKIGELPTTRVNPDRVLTSEKISGSTTDTYKLRVWINQDAASYDISIEQDGSVMQYNVLNEDGKTYTAYIEVKTKITAPEDSSCLLVIYTATSITGLENLDTSKVVNMRCFFLRGSCSFFRYFIIRYIYVTDMDRMFGSTKNMESLDFSVIDVSKVTSIDSLINDSNVKKLNLTSFSWDSANSINAMLSGASLLTTVDMSGTVMDKLAHTDY